jgi:hypothetical protein
MYNRVLNFTSSLLMYINPPSSLENNPGGIRLEHVLIMQKERNPIYNTRFSK